MKVRTFVFVAALALFISACGGSDNNNSPAPTAPSPTPTPTPSPTPSATTVTIPTGASTQTTTAFGANPLTIAVGTTVTFRNNDVTTHDATANAAGGFTTGNIGPGGSANVTFSTAGTIAYHCSIHPNMMGTLVVQ